MPFHPHPSRPVWHSVSFCLLAATLFPGCNSTSKKNAPLTLNTERVSIASSPATIPQRPLPPSPSVSQLKALSLNPVPSAHLAPQLNRLLTAPLIANVASKNHPQPSLSQNPHLGQFLRVASWNIEKSLRIPQLVAILKSEEAFKQQLKPEILSNPAAIQEALRQRQRLISADVLLLQEMDIGHPRSNYLHATREIAKALDMNYSFAPQQLETDPTFLGLEGGTPPDPKRYQGLFGIAVLSRQPILSATAFPLQTQPYDWYHDELKPITSIEKVRRFAAHVLVHSQFQRELKYGGRIFFRVDLFMPGLPASRLSIIHNHLEIKTTTLGREAQLKEVLNHIRPIPHAVIMAGDHNSAQTDVSATSLSRVVRRASTDPQTWVDAAANVWSVVPDGISLGRSILNNVKNLHNPLAAHIPLIFPNQTRRLFKTIEDFRFDDGGHFDTRGDRTRSINGKSSHFANSNQRYWKGLAPTFRVPRPIGPFGRTRLDWIFVKQPSEWQNSYRFAPHFGETLEMLDKGLMAPLSDHLPIIVDLPLSEPQLAPQKSTP